MGPSSLETSGLCSGKPYCFGQKPLFSLFLLAGHRISGTGPLSHLSSITISFRSLCLLFYLPNFLVKCFVLFLLSFKNVSKTVFLVSPFK